MGSTGQKIRNRYNKAMWVLRELGGDSVAAGTQAAGETSLRWAEAENYVGGAAYSRGRVGRKRLAM